MWSFASERALRRAVWTAFALVALAAAAFYGAQNILRPVGGEIAFVKLLWLAGVVLLWGVLPPLLTADARLGSPLRRAFAAFAGLMAVRVLAEGWMLYVSLSWSPWYGITHNALCMALLLSCAGLVRPQGTLDRLARGHLVATAAFFVPESYFAWYMLEHFVTRGASAVYFVPGDASHVQVLLLTAVAVVCLSGYLAMFVRRWTVVSGKRNA